jgi:hypothetical protein
MHMLEKQLVEIGVSFAVLPQVIEFQSSRKYKLEFMFSSLGQDEYGIFE